MIENIELCFRHRARVDVKKPIGFRPGLNVIIGPNGSGKSSLLEAIHSCPDCLVKKDNGFVLHYFNSETMNPHRTEKYFKGIDGSIIRVRAMFSSHGETLRDVLRYMPIKPGDCLLLDEPEAGQDLEWILKIRKGLDFLAAKKKCQIIVASHHFAFWKGANVIELKKDYWQKMFEKMKKEIL